MTWAERFRDRMRLHKLDRYVIATFLGPLGLCVLAFVGLFVVIDFFSNINEFLSHDSLFESARLTVMYYVLRLPSFLAQVTPILTALPAVICVIRLEQSNELAAMRSSGISARRVAAPVLACAGAIALLSAVNQEWIVPALHDPLAEVERRAHRTRKEAPGFAHAFDRDGRLFLISSYNADEPLPTLTGVTREWSKDGRVVREQKARRAFARRLGATWHMEHVEQFDAGEYTLLRRKPKWKPQPPQSFTSAAVYDLLDDYIRGGMVDTPLMVTDKGPPPIAYTFGGYTREGEGWPVARNIEVMYPARPELGRWHVEMMVWLEDHWAVFGGAWYGRYDPTTREIQERPFEDGARFETGARPSDMHAGGFKQASAMMTLAELADVASRFPRRSFGRRCWVIIWNRLAFPAANIVLALLAIPLVFRRSSRTALLGIAVALGMMLVFMAVNFVSIDLGNRGWFLWAWPFLAGTFPLFLFGGTAVWMFAKMDEV